MKHEPELQFDVAIEISKPELANPQGLKHLITIKAMVTGDLEDDWTTINVTWLPTHARAVTIARMYEKLYRGNVPESKMRITIRDEEKARKCVDGKHECT